MEKYGRTGQATDDSIIQPMRIASWIKDATDIQSEYVILIAIPLQLWLHERVSILRLRSLPVLLFPVALRLDSGSWPSLARLRNHTHWSHQLWTSDQPDSATST